MRSVSRNFSHRVIFGRALCLGLCFSPACRQESAAPNGAPGKSPSATSQPVIEPARYAGSDSCRACHPEAYAAWADSHHGLAERPVDPAVDAKAFRNKPPIRHGSVTSRVRERDGRFEIITLGKDGTVKPFAPKRVIGVDPLRQFMIEADRGRYQVAALSYDPHKDEWFDVFGEEDRRPHEWGFWANQGMNWNAMCADCHNTDVKKNYDPASDSYATTYAEMGVGCEACHGPASDHVAFQKANPEKAGDPSVPRLALNWSMNQWLDTCGSCHSRRAELRESFTPGDRYLDSFRPELPNLTDLYYADGKVRDELYEYVSFLTSRMHANNVTCLHCHDAHSGKRLAQGNALCLTCHNEQIDPAGHSHHDPAKPGGLCVDCHMPLTTYMQRHPRRDHGFIVPDPLLTKELRIPNACNGCHTDQSVDWAIRFVDQWYGEKMQRPRRAWARRIARARGGDPQVVAEILAAIESEENPTWRAIAAGLLGDSVDRLDVRGTLTKLLGDPSALVRTIAAGGLENGGPTAEKALAPLLEDPVRAVRLAAAWALRRWVDPDTPAGRELTGYLRHISDQPPGAMMLGAYWVDRGQPQRAIGILQRATEWEPTAGVLRHTLGIAYSSAGRLDKAAEACQEACRLSPDDPSMWHALGLARAELGQFPAAVEALEKAVQLSEDFSRAWYNLGLAYSQLGQTDRAIRALRRAADLEPTSADYQYALATAYVAAGRRDEAKAAARETLRIEFTHRPAAALLRELENPRSQ